MTTYYISPEGSDSNNGLGPDASHATNKPWLTPGKAMATGSPVVPGDTVYVGPGVVLAVNVIPIAGISSSASPTHFRGDPRNTQGFKDASGVRLAAGPAWIAARSAANLDAANLGGTMFNFQTNNPDGLQFHDLVLEVGGIAGSVFALRGDGSEDLVVEDCYVIGREIFYYSLGALTAARNLRMRRCVALCSTVIHANTTSATTDDADLDILFEDSLIIGRVFAGFSLGSTSGNVAGGVRTKGCTIVAVASSPLNGLASAISTVVPCRIERTLVISHGIAMGTAGQLVDDGYCRFIWISSAGHSNFTPAGTSVVGSAPALVLPHLFKWGIDEGPHAMLGWASLMPSAVRYSGATATTPDFRGRTARPWGAGPSIGFLEYGNYGLDSGSVITGGGANTLRITGAGEVSFLVPVNAGAQTLEVVTESSSYGGTNYPQLIVMPNPDIGITAEIAATATDASEQTLTTASFNPTAKGVLEVRLISRSTSTTSSTFFDLLASG